MNGSGSTATILVVDDHVTLAQGFAQALSAVGYGVRVAHQADAALREAYDCRPDAIILDFQLPFVNGAGFLYRLRADDIFHRTPVLVISGHTLSDDVKAELQDMDATVRQKPIGIADLIAEMRTLLRRPSVNPPI